MNSNKIIIIWRGFAVKARWSYDRKNADLKIHSRKQSLTRSCLMVAKMSHTLKQIYEDPIQVHIYTLIMLGHFKKSASILTDQTPKWSAMTDDRALFATLLLHFSRLWYLKILSLIQRSFSA